MGFSFFYRRNLPSPKIRAEQVAPFLDAKLNPMEGYEDDVCIAIAHAPEIFRRDRGIFKTPLKRFYLDIVDNHSLIYWLHKNPQCPVIVCSLSAADYVRERLKNRVVLIPQQHCNFDNELRPERPVVTVGIIGEQRSFLGLRYLFRNALAKHGLHFVYKHIYHCREDVVSFYRTIDIQLNWRNPSPPGADKLKNHMRVYNAASFGIPTVGQPHPSVEREFAGAYQPASSVEEAVKEIVRLRDDPVWYSELAGRALERSKQYHISNIITHYHDLERCL